ncbi:hypothetical protein CIPAW_13G079500 [Carya illinoinensis]|uniref:Uncharacterized protein n=1 Tax=Carya illinoinensis TaxID=32201 RepID=A0A8T1NMV9_CARIL|nr:hypothetical protein CIPAW_13G079500 [Carya illinoinensis]
MGVGGNPFKWKQNLPKELNKLQSCSLKNSNFINSQVNSNSLILESSSILRKKSQNLTLVTKCFRIIAGINIYIYRRFYSPKYPENQKPFKAEIKSYIYCLNFSIK